MATYTWPSTLPQVPQKGYTESIGANILRTPMDAGPAKMRYRGKRPDTLNVQFLMTTAQVTNLQSFVQDTLINIRRFNFTHPRTGSTVEVRIIPQSESMFSTSYVAPGYYQIGLQLEVLP